MAQNSKKSLLTGWGNTLPKYCNIFRPEEQNATLDIIKSSTSYIARGSGLSYGDAALNENGDIIDCRRLDHFIHFDSDKGLLKAESGVTLSQILNLIIPQGWILPVLPGAQEVTIGGAIASNIHGKNHYKEGGIAEHIEALSLLLPDGKIRICSKNEHTDLFHYTVGGMGLTGIILSAKIKLKPIKAASLKCDTRRVKDLEDMLICFQEAKDTHDYMVGWIDHAAKGNKLGQGYFEKANHSEDGLELATYNKHHKKKKALTIPKFFPSFLLNKWSMRLYNFYKFKSYNTKWKTENKPFDSFFHPLDNLKHWNRLYGKNGFLQYQFIIPESSDTESQIRDILETIHAHDAFSFLAVIKYHKDETMPLAFPLKGYSVALDFPNTESIHKLLSLLTEKVTQYGGRIYLAKDSTLSSTEFKTLYKKQLDPWLEQLNKIEDKDRISSNLAKRLGVKE